MHIELQYYREVNSGYRTFVTRKQICAHRLQTNIINAKKCVNGSYAMPLHSTRPIIVLNKIAGIVQYNFVLVHFHKYMSY